MAENKIYTKDDIDAVWSQEWRTQANVSTKKLFTHRLFVEGYAAYRRHLPKYIDRFVELGAGSGRYGLAVAKDHEEAHVLLTDPLQESVGAIQNFAQELQLSNVQITTADMCALPFADGAFDIIFADAVIQHIIDVDSALTEAYRVLKPEGRCIVSAVNTRNPFHAFYKMLCRVRGREYEYGYERTYTRHELREVMKRAGFDIVAEDGFYVAYGMYRWGYRFGFFKTVSKIINRIMKGLDAVTGRFLSRRYGFVIFCVATKKG